METLLFILIIAEIIDNKPEITSRLVKIQGIEKGQNIQIIDSEWGYLGTGKIQISYSEDKYGLKVFSFTSNEEEPRKFISEEPDELEYIEGEIFEGKKQTGTFVLRKISGVSVENPW